MTSMLSTQNIALGFGGWLAPVDLSTAGQNADAPQVAVDSQDDAVAVWTRSNGTNDIVQAAARPAGGVWQAPINLSAAGQNAEAPQVAVDGQGNAVAVWTRSNGTNDIVQAAARPAGGAWQAPINLSAAGQNALPPEVSVNAQGNAVAVWTRSNGTNFIVQAAARPAGGAWQTPVDLSAAGQNASFRPQVAVDGQGNAVAVWFRFDGTSLIVQAAARPAGGVWQAPINLSAAGQDARGNAVAMDARGNAVAVWTRSNGTNDIVQAAARPAGGAWQTPVDLSAAGQNAGDPVAAVNAQGNAVAVWNRSNGTNDIVQAAARPAGRAWQTPVDLSAAGQNAVAWQVAVDSQGDAVAVWTRSNGTNTIVQAAVRLHDVTPVDLSGTGQDASDPQVAIDSQGDAVAVWNRSNGTNDIVQAAARPAAGAWQAPINLSATGQNASDPQVTVDSQGNAVAVWNRSNGTNDIVQAAARPAAGAWQAPINLSATGQNASDPQVAINAQGNAVAVWTRFNGTNDVVQAAARSAAGAWQAPINLSAAGQNALAPQVGIDGQGDAVAVWIRSNGINDIVQAAARSGGGAWQAPINLSGNGQNASDPQVAINAQGNAVAVWTRSNGTNDIVQAAVRSAAGAWQAPINLSAAGQNAVAPQVGIDGQGNSVAVWTRSNGSNDIVQAAARSGREAWQAPINLSAAGQNAGAPQVAVNAQGNAVAIWRRFNRSNWIVQAAATT
jgi:hypothetical protein